MKSFNKKFNFFLLLIFAMSLLLFTALSCDTTEPIEDNTQPGRRDYMWVVDTIDATYNTYSKMWGSSPEDVWMVSSGSSDKGIAHYDGESWVTYGVYGMYSQNALHGFASDDIYIGSGNGKVWHYNGSSWIKIAELKKDGSTQIVFQNMWGESPDNIYAVGAYPDDYGFNNSVIINNGDNSWKNVITGSLYGIITNFFKNSSDNNIYLQLVKLGGGRYIDSTQIYEYKNGNYIKLYSDIWSKGEQADIQLINGNVYFILGNRIAVRAYNQFYTLVNVDNPNFYQRIWGRSSKDLFLLMTEGLVHFNGSDMKYLFHFNKPEEKPWTQIFGAALFENEVFFIVSEANPNLNLIYHGILNLEE